MSIDEQHVALPKLYGAPAYARPPRLIEETARPFDPDEQPILAEQTDLERELAETLPAASYLSIGHRDDDGGNRHNGGGIQARPFRLRSLAGKLLRGN